MNIPLNFRKEVLKSAWFSGGISFAIVLFYGLLILQPRLQNMGGILAKIGHVKTELREVEADIVEIEKFKSRVESYKTKVDSYEKKLPAEQEIPALLEDLSKMAKDANVKILGIVPGAAPKEVKPLKTQVYQEIPILITAKCGYHELGKFIDDLESGNRFMRISDIKIKANKATPKKHDVELLVSTFVLRQENNR